MRYRPLLTAAMVFAVCFGRNAPLRAGPTPDEQKKGGNKQRGRNAPDKPAPKAGEPAPLFKLKTLGGEKEVDLKSLLEQRPVLLFFGSYT